MTAQDKQHGAHSKHARAISQFLKNTVRNLSLQGELFDRTQLESMVFIGD